MDLIEIRASYRCGGSWFYETERDDNDDGQRDNSWTRKLIIICLRGFVYTFVVIGPIIIAMRERKAKRPNKRINGDRETRVIS